MLREIQALSETFFPEVVRLRRILHANPELAFEEYETARLVTETLQPLGLEIQTGVARTGVVATLHGAEAGPTILLRADMDALPIHEENDFDFRSRHPGKMHACGHDAHTASLLGTAMILARLRDRLRGHVRLVFQPSEEKLPGGAQAMIQEGVLEASNGVPAPSAVFAQHVQPDLPVGTIGVRPGMYMASADELYITIRTDGGHAAAPHRQQADGVLVAAHIIMALQSVVSRNAPPDVPTVLSIGRVLAEGATNVLPPTVRMEGTFRAMDEDWRFRAHALIRRIVEQTARAFGAEADVEIAVGYPALYNHEQPTALVRKAACEYVGPDRVVLLDPWFASEDFAYFLKERPGCFYRIGTGNPDKGIVHGLHTPRFTIDEEALRIAPGFMAYLAWRYLQSAP
ncbi:M20 metallopeptidase family protein [Rhodothermus profundi]|uniref:Hippurate hydrolase n=1 Tax=Rhodothermus profundi TaxID=633813 RepID=A0A1M6VDW4_9BACT|nr:M20 family metallopeptidase [Rhodothermus profundi]SHK79486.1 hippurate hydrolase [Rhodothermus profundi]